MDVELGIIEGFYGRPWTWGERAETAEFLAPHGYRFFLYAPKADPYLRKRWMENHPEEQADQLRSLADRCRGAGVRFGIGLSPYEIHLDYDDQAREALAKKVSALVELGIQDLAILFDDMRGDIPDLARQQAEIVDFVAQRAVVDRLIVCPSYYTDDPVLDRVFGQRPDEYLEDLGRRLDRSVEIIWTGEEVCSREISAGHLRRVTEQLGRKPFIWDNYPVNDGERMSRYLHLRGFTGRPAQIAAHVSAHGINPALQPVLTRIPALTLVESYRMGDAYQYADATRRAAAEVLGPELGELVSEDILPLQEIGLERLADAEQRLRDRYTGVDHPGAREIVAWLNGEYSITDAAIQEQ